MKPCTCCGRGGVAGPALQLPRRAAGIAWSDLQPGARGEGCPGGAQWGGEVHPDAPLEWHPERERGGALLRAPAGGAVSAGGAPGGGAGFPGSGRSALLALRIRRRGLRTDLYGTTTGRSALSGDRGPGPGRTAWVRGETLLSPQPGGEEAGGGRLRGGGG